MIKEKYGKPVIITLAEEVTDVDLIEFEVDRRRLRQYYMTHGIPVYPSLERAARALANVLAYQKRFQP